MTKLSVSSDDDNLLVIHLMSNNDLVVSLQPEELAGMSRVGEAVGALVHYYSKSLLFATCHCSYYSTITY